MFVVIIFTEIKIEGYGTQRLHTDTLYMLYTANGGSVLLIRLCSLSNHDCCFTISYYSPWHQLTFVMIFRVLMLVLDMNLELLTPSEFV